MKLANTILPSVTVEPEQAVRLRIHDYMARTGISQPVFAQRIGYSYDTLRLFLTDRYHRIARSADQLMAAANEFMDRHPVGPRTHALGELYDTANVRVIRDTVDRLLPRPVAYMLYAPPGSQKSFVLENEVARLNAAEISQRNGRRAFYVYARQDIKPRDLVRRVAIACGSRANNNLDAMLADIRFDFSSNRVVLIVDEAQHLSIPCFEVLRELLDQPPHFSLLLSGSHDLKKKFDEFSATLEQWNSRIIAKVRLPGLEHLEAVGIIEREIGEILARQTPGQSKALTDKLIKGATSRDAFNGNQAYINVRTLTNALEQVKAQMKAQGKAAQKSALKETA